jgi:hypothetical protein
MSASQPIRQPLVPLPPPPVMAPPVEPSYQGRELYVPISHTPLPNFCIKCGQLATVRKSKTFYWIQPAWYLFILLGLLGVVVLAVVAMMVRKSIRMEVPLCQEHARKLTFRKIMTAVLLLGFIPVGVAGTMMGDDYVVWAWLIATAMFFAGLVFAVLASNVYLRPMFIDATYAKFRGPCDAFLRMLPLKP